MILSKIILKPGKEQSVKRLHPWIFSGAIKKISSDPQEGDIVKVYSNEQEFLAIGHFAYGSIAVRIFSFENVEIDHNFWYNKIKAAYNFRNSLGIIDDIKNNVYRLVHGEGDQMPGVIIDIYNNVAVIQMHSYGMYRMIDEFSAILQEIYGTKLKAVYNKSSRTIHSRNVNITDGYLYGFEKETIVTENGLKFKINWEDGQKTGFFIDQRENRKLLQQYTKDKDVLNVFAYTGGFSVYGLAGGAKSLVSVDSSAQAMQLTDENIVLNFGENANHQSLTVDAFKYLNNIDNKFDVIILDPPAFAKHHKVLNKAIVGYKKINQKAFEQIRKGGILFTFSCSQAVSASEFRKAVFVAAANAGRNIRVIHKLTQAPDHPVSIYHPEGDYLKGLVLYVE